MVNIFGPICIFVRVLSQSFPIDFTYSVDKLCIKLWVSRWIECGEKFAFLWKIKFYTKTIVKLRVLHSMVEKFYLGFYTRINRDKSRVLHSFHRPYYYYY